MSRELTEAARCAALIRAELNKHRIAAIVRSRNFAGGNAVDVTLMNDPLPATVQQVEAFCGKLRNGHFDGMTDCYHYAHHDDNLPRAKYVQVSVRYSDAIRAEARTYLDTYWGDSRAAWQRDQDVWPCLNGTLGHFWTDRKPRVRLAAEAAPGLQEEILKTAAWLDQVNAEIHPAIAEQNVDEAMRVVS